MGEWSSSTNSAATEKDNRIITIMDGYSPSLPPPATIPRKTSKIVPKGQKTSNDDPLARAIAPPPDETPEEQDFRIAAELEAEQVSDAIDDELNRQRIADKKKLKPVKILLLGALSAPLLTPPRSTTTPPSSWQVRANPVCRHIIIWLSPLSVLSRKIYYPEE